MTAATFLLLVIAAEKAAAEASCSRRKKQKQKEMQKLNPRANIKALVVAVGDASRQIEDCFGVLNAPQFPTVRTKYNNKGRDFQTVIDYDMGLLLAHSCPAEHGMYHHRQRASPTININIGYALLYESSSKSAVRVTCQYLS